jgi:hypothetical protein
LSNFKHLPSPTHPDIEYVEYAHLKGGPGGRQVFTRCTSTWANFVQKLITHTPAEDKKSVPLFAPNTFSEEYTSRKKYGVTSMTALVFDIERKVNPIHEEEIVALNARLEASCLEYVLISSHSHREPDYCRFRLVLPISRPLQPNEYEEARQRISHRLGLEALVDPASEDISRIYFWPSHPPDVEPVVVYTPGKSVNVEDLLTGYVPLPMPRVRGEVPADWEYVAPMAPEEDRIDVKAFQKILEEYKGKGETPQDIARKVDLARRIRHGQPLATSNLNSALWSAVNLLAFNLPPHTSSVEIMAVLRPSLAAMYSSGNGPITLEKAKEVAGKMVDRAVEARAASDAVEAERKAFITRQHAELEAALKKNAQKPPTSVTSVEELAQLEAALPRTDFVFCVPHEVYYYREEAGGRDEFNLRAPVRKKETITEHLRAVGWEEDAIKFCLKAGTYLKTHGIDCAPRKPSIYTEGGLHYLNAWKPPTLVPKQGEWPSIDRVLDSLTLNNIELEDGTVVCRPDPKAKAYIINWLAWTVQNPAGVPGTALLFNGAQGSGKNILAYTMFDILGRHNCAQINNKSLDSRFNSRWIGKCFIFGDEIFTKETANELAATLKEMITGQASVSEGKGINEHDLKNRASFMFASNELVPLRLDRDDRRFCVFTRHDDVQDDYKAFTRTLFLPDNSPTEAFREEIAAFAWDLEHLQVDNAMARSAYVNYSKLSLIDASQTTHSSFCQYVDEFGVDGLLYEGLARTGLGINKSNFAERSKEALGDWDFGEQGVSFRALYEAYVFHCAKSGNIRPVAPARFGMTLNAHRPVWQRHRTIGANKQRHNCYVVKRTPIGKAQTVTTSFRAEKGPSANA